jgi:hypothetical protein
MAIGYEACGSIMYCDVGDIAMEYVETKSGTETWHIDTWHIDIWKSIGGAYQGRTRKRPPKTTSGSFLKTPAVDLAGSFRENDLEGRFRTTPCPVNIRNYHILPYNRL